MWRGNLCVLASDSLTRCLVLGHGPCPIGVGENRGLTLESASGSIMPVVASKAEKGRWLRIGEVAAQSGLSVDALRYYERLGLLPRAARTPSGYRLYEAGVVERIGFIKRAQRFGFTLEEIRQMVSLQTADPRTCARVLEMIEHKLDDLDRHYEEIRRLRRELSVYKTACKRAVASGHACPVIEDFVRPRGVIRDTGKKRSRKDSTRRDRGEP